MSNNRQEPFPTKYSPENLLRIDKASFRRTLLRPKLVILLAKLWVRECLVSDRDLLETLFSMRIVRVLVRVVFDSQPSW
jgi:hypothetical protein